MFIDDVEERFHDVHVADSKTVKVVVKHNRSGYGHDTSVVAEFCTRFKMPEFKLGGMYMGLGGREDVPENEPELQAISQLPGVIEMSNYSFNGLYDIVVKRGGAFTWAELEPQIVALLEKRHDRMAALSNCVAFNEDKETAQ